MKISIPRLLLVSEVTLSYSVKSQSSNPTLFNLFHQYSPNSLLQITTTSSITKSPLVSPFKQQWVALPSHYFQTLNNRFGKYINPFIEILNYKFLETISIPKSIRLFSPEIILICPTTPWGLIIGEKIVKQLEIPFLVYFMDDWIGKEDLKFARRSARDILYKLLKQSCGWLMISDSLYQETATHYQIFDKPCLTVHNPVDLSIQEKPDLNRIHTGTFKVVYAGSIQVMHYDALAIIAQAIFELRSEGKDIQLIIHTSPDFWNIYKENWLRWQVEYGSLIPYQELNQHLQKADLLLVATSFLRENARVIRSSLLTKLTDYMAAGRPILSCGPSYSACNHFLEKWQCGLICSTNSLAEVKSFLSQQLENRSNNQKLAVKAFKVLEDNFETSKINHKLYEFISQLAFNKKLV